MKALIQNTFSHGLILREEEEPEVEEVVFQDPEIYKKAKKIAHLLKLI